MISCARWWSIIFESFFPNRCHCLQLHPSSQKYLFLGAGAYYDFFIIILLVGDCTRFFVEASGRSRQTDRRNCLSSNRCCHTAPDSYILTVILIWSFGKWLSCVLFSCLVLLYLVQKIQALFIIKQHLTCVLLWEYLICKAHDTYFGMYGGNVVHETRYFHKENKQCTEGHICWSNSSHYFRKIELFTTSQVWGSVTAWWVGRTCMFFYHLWLPIDKLAVMQDGYCSLWLWVE